MPISPQDILNLAHTLHKQPCDECTHRTIISRAYYSSFHCVKQYAEQHLGFSHKDQSKSSHKALTDHLTQNGTPKDKNTSKKLRALKKHRVIADYCLNKPIPNELSAECLNRAQTIFQDIQKPAPQTSAP